MKRKARQVPILQALACGAAARQVVDLEEASKEESHAKSLSADAEDPSCEKATPEQIANAATSCPALVSWPLHRLPAQPATVRTVRVGETGRAVSVSDQELAAIAPVQLIRHALPHELADQLLDSLLQESDSWKASSWIVHGNQFTTPRTSAIYEFAAGGPSSSEDGFGKEESRTRCEPSATLDRAADLVQNLVRERRPFANWAPTLALGNRYENGRACVGWHSDFLNSLGPRPIIVGLSLGSCRRFCLRRSTAPDSPRDASKTIVASIPMPHNTVVIMWDDCQEEWQHSVPRQADSTVEKHAVAGLVRLSLTFRMSRPELAQHRKSCHCGRPSALKSKEGRYYLACCPMGTSKQCGFWEPCSWAQEEAERLRQKMKLEMESLEFPGTRAESPQYSHRRLTGIQEFSNSRSRNEASTTWNARSGNPHVADRVSIEISDDDT
ncbi:ALKBH3 [Symbiodinium necroappetens]|uniref:ALKBH3 protein n=1 Tax=Symbiodinium necroappetens TaxID=1628268 RepID=A0A812QWV0_9DINO|nr:ALKBH3 [Symbiodinium necroappetens]